MFNSQKINNDPQSWTCPVERHKGTRMSIREAVKCCGMATNLAGRTEYDNNPNPILLQVRELASSAEHGLYLMDAGYIGYRDDSTHEHIIHARKVLTRLVNVYGDS